VVTIVGQIHSECYGQAVLSYHPASGCRASRVTWAGSCSSSGWGAGLAAGSRGGELVMAEQIHTSLPEGSATWRATVVSCWLCGIHLRKQQMVPDGSSAWADIRWYCKDAQACTERWTASRRQRQAAGAA